MWIEKIVNSELIRKIITPFNPRKHECRLLALFAAFNGTILAFVEVFGEGLPSEGNNTLLVVTVFVTLEAAGVSLGYVFFRRFLGIFRTE